MDDETRVAAIRERVEAATEGEWEETWKPVVGSDGYEVSDFGNVRSYFKKGNHTDKRTEFPRALSRRGGKTGYPGVSIKNAQGNYVTRAIHRLVMEAFVGPVPAGMEVAHLNGNSDDARLVNLAYVTHRENESHKLIHGTSPLGERNGQAVLQGWQVAEMRYLAAKSVPQGKMANLFDLDQKRVSEILSGRTWTDVEAREDIPWLLDRLRAAEAAIAEEREVYRQGHDALVARSRAAEARAAEAEAVIAEAPHHPACLMGYGFFDAQCTCWKSRYRAGDDHE